MPTEKRARQKAARRRKREAQARKVRFRRRLRSGGLMVAGAAVVLLVVLATTGVFSSGTAPSSSSTGTTTTTAATSTASTTTTGATSTSSTSSTTTSTTLTSAQAAADQSQADAAAAAAGCPSSTSTRVNTLQWSSAPAMSIDTSKTYQAVVKTTAGTFTIQLLAKTAPHTVNNFVFLADHSFYNCVIFHRVIPGFMNQTGDPTGTGSGGPGYKFANENLPKSYAPYDVAMANSGPNTNGSQFFIVVPGGQSGLSPTYSLFGKVVSGQSVVTTINAEGNATPSANGVPPKVVQRILSVAIQTS